MEFNIRCPYDIYEAECTVEKMDSGWKLKRDLLKPEDYVWDEEMSVKANREYTKQYNETILENAKDLDSKKIEARNELRKAVLKYIMEEYDVTEILADIVWTWCCIHHEDEAHHYISDAMDLIDNVMEKVVNAK
jgi:hypothetical protein